MSYFAHIEGLDARVLTVRGRIPAEGVWWMQVQLEGASSTPSGRVTLVLGDLSLVGTVVVPRSGTFNTTAALTIVGGAGGWSNVIARRPYHNDAGISASQVARDAAADAGETLTITAADTSLGVDFTRREDAAARALRQAFPTTPWWVEYDGTSTLGTRPTGTVPATAYSLEPFDPLGRRMVVSSETPAALRPGLQIVDTRLAAPFVIGDIDVSVGKGGARFVLEEGANRALQALQALIRQAQWATLQGIYRYRVVEMVADRAALQPVDRSRKLPDLPLVDEWAGTAGSWAELAEGTEVLVAFADGDARYPVILSHAPKGAPAAVPVRVELDASTIVRLGESAGEVLVGADADSPAAVARAAGVQASLDLLALTLNAVVNLLTAGVPGTPVVTVPQTPPMSPVVGLSADPAATLKAV